MVVKSHFVWKAKMVREKVITAVIPIASNTSRISKFADITPNIKDWARVNANSKTKFNGDFLLTPSQHAKVINVTRRTTIDVIQSQGLAMTQR